jgi:hypothetical protein
LFSRLLLIKLLVPLMLELLRRRVHFPLRLQRLAVRHGPELVPVDGALGARLLEFVAGLELAHGVLQLHQRA